MFFLIRCVFWLTVVFSNIFNMELTPLTPPQQAEPGRRAEMRRPVETARRMEKVSRAGAGAAPQGIGEMAQAWVMSAVMHVWSKSSSRCGATREDCVALAARLSDFARNHSFDETAATNAPSMNAPWVVLTASRAAAVPARLVPSIPAKTDIPLPPLRPQRAHLASNR